MRSVKRLGNTRRRDIIIRAGVSAAREVGYQALTHDDVQRHCAVDTSVATIRRYFPRIETLLGAILDRAPDLPATVTRNMP